MLSNTIFLSALAAFTTISYGSTLPADFAIRRNAEDILNVVPDNHILAAFEEAGHPAATPYQTWQDDNGTTYRSHYIFDTDEWNEMHASLLGQRGISVNPAHLAIRALQARADDPPSFYCKGFESAQFAYSYTLSTIAGGICQAFVFGAELAGKTQIIRENVPDIHNNAARVTFKYTWKTAQWATATTCAIAMNYGITQACTSEQEGVNGKQPATKGWSESYGADCDCAGEVDAA